MTRVEEEFQEMEEGHGGGGAGAMVWLLGMWLVGGILILVSISLILD
jgi:hypothetical protein